MKRCPECRRDYYDDTLLYCLDDGNVLLEGPATGNFPNDEPATAILPEPGAVATGFPASESPTKPQINTTNETAILPTDTGNVGPKSGGLDKRLLATPFLLSIVVLVGFFGYRYFAPGGGAINSIAVLPFANASGDKETEFLSDGISETLINNFTRIPELKVTARSTAFRFRGREAEPQAIGRELGVGSILTGKLIQRGDNVSIQVDLVNTTDGLQIWGNRYDGKASEIVSIQQKISTDVSSQLKLKLTGAQAQQIAKTYTENAEAYQHYLRGRYYWNKRTGNDLRKSVESYDAAIALDPNFALAYAGLADSYVLFPSYAGAQPEDAFPKAEAAAKKALDLDESLAEAHTALSFAYFNYDWKFDESEKQIRRAIALNPNYSTAYHWYGNANLLALGRFDESIEAMKKAYELDPLSLIINADLATSYCYALRLDEAIVQYNRTLEMDSSFYYAHVYLGRAYLLKGDYQKALDELQKASGLESDPRIPMLQSRIYSRMGRRADALRMLEKLKGMQRERYISNFNFAIVYAGLGDLDNAFASLENSFKAHDGNLVYLKADPLLADLRGDPRFREMLKRLNLPE